MGEPAAARALIVQHVAAEPAGTIASVLSERGIVLDVVRVFEGQAIPRLEDAAAVVVLGGPMAVYQEERLSHLRQEKRLIAEALDAQRPILGVCLGSQLLASVLGATVGPASQREIGWFDVSLLPDAASDECWREEPSWFKALHWHGDVFGCPKGAVPLARSAATAVQAFCYGRAAYGLLFHLEMDESQLCAMARADADYLRANAVDGEALCAEGRSYTLDVRMRARRVFGRWADLAAPGDLLRAEPSP